MVSPIASEDMSAEQFLAKHTIEDINLRNTGSFLLWLNMF